MYHFMWVYYIFNVGFHTHQHVCLQYVNSIQLLSSVAFTPPSKYHQYVYLNTAAQSSSFQPRGV